MKVIFGETLLPGAPRLPRDLHLYPRVCLDDRYAPFARLTLAEKPHWAESTIIALARRSAAAGFTSIKILISEDYDARRVACTVPHTRGVSIHALLHQRVQRNRMTAEAAAASVASVTPCASPAMHPEPRRGALAGAPVLVRAPRRGSLQIERRQRWPINPFYPFRP